MSSGRWPRKWAASTSRRSLPSRAGSPRTARPRRSGPTPWPRRSSGCGPRARRRSREAITSFFPSITIDEHIDVINRHRNAGGPIWTDGPEVDKGGIEKLQEMMILVACCRPTRRCPTTRWSRRPTRRKPKREPSRNKQVAATAESGFRLHKRLRHHGMHAFASR